MRNISDTIARMSALRQRAGAPSEGNAQVHLESLASFGSNPGALLAKIHIPKSILPGAPLVVVLHGCTQNADAYDRGSGWSQLAEREGFALLFPEQQRANNANLCFNWFVPEDTCRDGEEALSI